MIKTKRLTYFRKEGHRISFSINEGEIPNIHMKFYYYIIPIFIYIRLTNSFKLAYGTNMNKLKRILALLTEFILFWGTVVVLFFLILHILGVVYLV